MKHVLCALVTVMLGSSMPAQATWIVDSLGRPGSHFTDIQPAVDAAAPGDLIIVKATRNLYQAATIRKGIRLVGVADLEAIPLVFSGFVVSDVPQRQWVSIRHFRLVVGPSLSVVRCAGSVHIAQIDTFSNSSTRFQFDACSFLTLQDVCMNVTDNSVQIMDSSVYLHDCALGARRLLASRGPVTITATDSRLVFIWSRIIGAGVEFNVLSCQTLALPSEGIQATDCDIVVGPGSRIDSGNAQILNCSTVKLPAFITTRGSLWVDPRATVDLSKGHGTATLIRDTVPAVTSGPATRGTTMPLSTYGAPGGLVVVFASLPNPASIVIPGLGTAWIDPALVFPVDSGQLDSTGLRRSTVPIGNAVPEGLALLFQGVEAAPGTFRLTFPSVTAVR